MQQTVAQAPPTPTPTPPSAGSDLSIGEITAVASVGGIVFVGAFGYYLYWANKRKARMKAERSAARRAEYLANPIVLRLPAVQAAEPALQLATFSLTLPSQSPEFGGDNTELMPPPSAPTEAERAGDVEETKD
jgi:hypothetical protein